MSPRPERLMMMIWYSSEMENFKILKVKLMEMVKFTVSDQIASLNQITSRDFIEFLGITVRFMILMGKL